MKVAVLVCCVLLALGLSVVDAAPKAAPKQPLAREPLAKKPKAGSGKCVSESYVVLETLVPFSKAAAACTKAGKKLATIDAVFGGKNAALSTAAKAALIKCVGQNYQVWYDTTQTMHDKPATCTAFMATLAPTDGPTVIRKAGSHTVILPTTVLPATKAGCHAKLPVLCM